MCSDGCPGLQAVRSYRREWLAKDIVAGVVLTTLLVPQGMAYAELAGLPPITGLYTSILCLLGYAVFGPSRILVLGPDSSLGPMIAAAEPVTDVDTTASDVLEDLDEALNAQGISLVCAELKDPVRDKIERYGLTRTIDPRHFFPTLESAVAAFRQQTSAEWTTAGQATDHLQGPGPTGAGTSPPPDVPASPPAS